MSDRASGRFCCRGAICAGQAPVIPAQINLWLIQRVPVSPKSSASASAGCIRRPRRHRHHPADSPGHARRPLRDRGSEQIPAIVRPGDRVLEIGAGIGFISTLLAREKRVARVIAVEANPDLLAYMTRLHGVNHVRKVRRLNAVLTNEPVEFGDLLPPPRLLDGLAVAGAQPLPRHRRGADLQPRPAAPRRRDQPRRLPTSRARRTGSSTGRTCRASTASMSRPTTT